VFEETEGLQFFIMVVILTRKFSAITVLLTLISMPIAASDYGTNGLIDIPTARMSYDGILTSTVAIQGRTNSYSMTYQATPWFEGTFRYTGFNNFKYYDRNYGVKLRLWPEQGYIPQVSVGIRDLIGTGRFGSEYLVASKKIGNLDVTFGTGWGRLAGTGVISNPLRVISERFSTREKNSNGNQTGGVLQPGLFFSGKEIGFFGGASYQLESLPVSLMVEYNPDQYDFEFRQTGLRPKNRWSMAVNWQARPGVELSISRQHNDEWGVSLVAEIDTKSAPARKPKPLFRSSLNIPKAELPPGLNKDSWYDRLLYDVERSGLILVEATVEESSRLATIIMGNSSYPMWTDAINEMTQLADLHLPSQVKLFRIVVEEEGHQIHSLYIDRPSSDLAKRNQVIRRDPILAAVEKPKIPQYRTDFSQNKVFIDANLSTRFQFFDPDDPARYQLYGKLGISVPLPKNWALRGAYSLDIDNTFNEITRVSDSVLPHVRSDIARYLSEGESGLDSLFFEKRGSLSSELHYRFFAGVLEEMYSGIGGELLYQPYQSRLAFGLSSNRVQQRDYDKSLKQLDYKANTAFASMYWATPFYNFDLAIHAGHYLAGDDGATFELRRTFPNGWMIGLWATLTDVSSKDFGEGSFDKGIFLRVPLDRFFNRNVRASYSTRVRPIQRDGGARLEDFSGNIWWNLRGARYDSLRETTSRVFP
jgi:hypothetical protein